jgi:ABC-type nitrate/sulfonate/bicarbonate transport system permease component
MARAPATFDERPFWLCKPLWTRLGLIITLIVIWEILARLFGDPQFVAPPSKIIMGLPAMLTDQGVFSALLLTLGELSAAFALAVGIGLPLGLAIGLRRFSMKTAMPIVLLLYATPQVTILPLFILYFGIGPASKIAFGVSHGMFPIIVTVVASVQNLPPVLMRAARTMGASPWQIFYHVIFPHIVPAFVTAMRLAIPAVLLGVLLAEMYVSQNGVGYFVRKFTNGLDPTNLFGLVLVIAVIAIVLNECVRRAERHFSRWRS